MKLADRTGATPRVIGGVGLVALVVTVLVLPEAPPEPEAAPEPTPAPVAAPLMEEGPAEDPLRLRESSRVRRLVPIYPGARFSPMGLLEANGNMMEMGVFDTTASTREVLDFYTREFGKRGRRVVEQPDDNGGGVVNYYDETLGVLVSVSAVRSGSGKAQRTLVFPTVVAAPEGMHLKAEAPASLPQPDGALTMLRVDDHSSGPSQGSSTVTQVAHGTPKQLVAFYLREFAARGYASLGKSTQADVEILEFEKEGERVSLTISPVQKEGPPESLVAVILEDPSKRKEQSP